MCVWIIFSKALKARREQRDEEMGTRCTEARS